MRGRGWLLVVRTVRALGWAFLLSLSSVACAAAIVAFSTYLGGSTNDRADEIALDGAGNVYVSGIVGSANFPGTDSARVTNAGLGLIETNDIYRRDCPVTLRRGLYRQWNTHVAYMQEVYSHRLGGRSEVQPAMLAGNEQGEGPRRAIHAKLDGYSCAVATTEKWDLTGMIPFSPATATAWQINF